jgi:twitching motility two-component system response regulator PilH
MANILFIDDDPSSLEVLGKAAELLGHRASLHNSAKAGLEAAQKEQPDLILLDLMMPGRDGWSVLDDLKALPGVERIPVAVLSADDRLTSSGETDHPGAQAYLSKPITLAILKEIIEKLTPSDKNI